MIEITKHGKMPEPEKLHVLTFTCPTCGCEFRTDEYVRCAECTPNGHRWIECICPEEGCCNMFSVEDNAAKAILG